MSHVTISSYHYFLPLTICNGCQIMTMHVTTASDKSFQFLFLSPLDKTLRELLKI